jgi:hypothetical protein
MVAPTPISRLGAKFSRRRKNPFKKLPPEPLLPEVGGRDDVHPGDQQRHIGRRLPAMPRGRVRRREGRRYFASLGSGVDVMNLIFCDFRQFSAKKMAFSAKANVVINFFII